MTGNTTGEIRKVSVSGGPPVVICRTANFNGAAWGAGDLIVFATAEGLFRVAAAGGDPVAIATPAREPAQFYARPSVLPDASCSISTARIG